jgi:hypothetical protein
MIRSLERRSHVVAASRAQHQVLSTAQLRSLEVDRWAVQRAVASGDLHRVAPGVYATRAPEELTLDGWAMVSVLARGAPTASTGVTAVMRHGAWDRSGAVIEASTSGRPGRLSVAAAPGGSIHLHQPARWTPSQVEPLRGVPTRPPIDACRDLGRTLTPLQITFIIREFVRRNDFDITTFEQSVAIAGSFRGKPVISEAIDWYHRNSAGTRGPNEDELCRLIAGSDLPFPMVNARGATGIPDIEADFVWPRFGRVLELNDRRHLLPGAAEADAEKQRRLESAGWSVTFIPGWRVWCEPHHVLDEIRQLLTGR